MFGKVTCFIRRGKTVAIDGRDVLDSDSDSDSDSENSVTDIT